MRTLWQRGPLAVKDLAQALQLDYGTLSLLLKRLENAGLVGRERRSDNERSVEIASTDAGNAMREMAADVPARLTCALELEDDGEAQLRDMLKRLTDSIGAGGS